MSDYYLVDAIRLKNVVAKIMMGKGVPERDADIVADSLVDADLSNLQSHGVQRVKFYCDGINAGGTNPVCEMTTIQEHRSSAVLNANGALGIVAAYNAMLLAMEKAKETGIGIVNVRNSNHCSCMGYYARMATENNMLAIVASNAPKSMVPWGSCEKYLGTNPIAIGVPTNKDPLILDLATSVVARGKIILADKKGEPIPEGWAIDVNGNPTTDPAEALKGCVLPFGGAKGSGIAMMIDIFAGVLSGALYGSHIHNPFTEPEMPMDTGHCMIAIDISKFQEVAEFKNTMDSYWCEVKSLKPAANSKGVFLPGEMKSNNRRNNLEKGIELPIAVYGELEELCEGLEIEFSIRK